MRLCTVDGCGRPHSAKGWCNTHYAYSRRGKPLIPIDRIPAATRDADGRKHCAGCKQWKQESEFGKRNTKSVDGLHSQCFECQNDSLLRLNYSLTIDEYWKMHEAQGGVCALCSGVNESGKRLHVDHDHRCCKGTPTCGKCTRALLCASCNLALGRMNDDPDLLERGAAYIRRYADGR